MIRLTVGRRIAGMIAVSVVALVMLGTMAVNRLAATQDNLRQISDVTLQAVDIARDLNTQMVSIRMEVLRHIAAKDVAPKLTAEKAMQDRVARIQALLATYGKLPLAADDLKQAEVLSKATAEYMEVVKPILDVSRALDPNNPPPVSDPRAVATARLVNDTIDGIVQRSQESAAAAREAAEAAYSRTRTTMITLIVIASALVLGLGVWLQRSVTRPLAAARDATANASTQLDFTLRVNSQQQDEIADTARALDGLLGTLQKSFRGIGNTVDGVVDSSRSMSHTADEVSRSAALAAESASSIAATIEELTVSINHVGDRAQDASSMSRDAGQMASDGERVILDTVARINAAVETVRSAASGVEDLRQQADAIGGVVRVIKEIADQTNLLALNAAIEAARAGELGRGFAVVADEVRKLAERTTKATLEIEGMIGGVQNGALTVVDHMGGVAERVRESAEGAQVAGETITRIRDRTNEALHMVSEIAQAISEQAQASNAISQQVERIAQISEENNAAASSTADAAHRLDLLTDSMKKEMARYRV
ncbi:methyl-accepting chemotaxis protein [Uliginosibacterium sp. H1]|uniref:methyl-accepting chemotaxis protein n=1 Tax=Uliginosibacterium sp. H1 TaxID=3114757 RepID=UPI002E191B72|nr:methyl-accepting chemotaxis protein [Uliginosibacterium sp. H1]